MVFLLINRKRLHEDVTRERISLLRCKYSVKRENILLLYKVLYCIIFKVSDRLVGFNNVIQRKNNDKIQR